MRAALVELAGDRATVRLMPGRIARLFGAQETVADLHVAEVENGWRGVRAPERWDDGSLRWRFAATDRLVRGSQHGERILCALEQVPVAAPARAVALPAGS
jgi:hypothetical protein